jgi:hypothetical protein
MRNQTENILFQATATEVFIFFRNESRSVAFLRFLKFKYHLKAGILEPEQMSIARQRIGKHIPAATSTQETIEELPFLCNGEVNTPSQQ